MTRAIGFYVHHHGSGHLARAVQVASACDSPVVGFSTMPEPQGWPGRWIVLPDDDAPVDEVDDPTAGGVLHWAPLGAGHPYPERMQRLAAALTQSDLALLHVDVSVEVTLLARLLGIPVTVAAMRGDRSDLPHRLAYDVAHLLVAPWPAHLPERGWPAHVLEKTVHVGGISRFDGLTTTPPPTGEGAAERTVFVLWGRGGGDWPDEAWDAARAATPGWRWRLGAEPDSVWEEVQGADVVVAHAGQNAVAEIAAARRPAVVVALDRPHGEQLGTVAALDADDLASTIDASAGVPDLDWARLLDEASRRDGTRWARWSDGHGATRAASALEAVARGRHLATGTAVVTLVHGRHDHLRGLVAGLARGTSLPERLVVVAMDDPEVADVCRDACAGTGLRLDVVEVDGGSHLPLARARNTGATRAGELGCSTLVFLDVDCIPAPELVETYAAAVRDHAGDAPVVWSGPVTYLPPAPEEGYDLSRLADLADPHPARPAPAPGDVIRAEDLRLFWSLSYAMSLADHHRLGGFCEDYVGYGGEDTDFAMRLESAAGELFWLGGADAYHQHHPTEAPPVRHLHDIVRNANLFASRWGWHPMEGWLAQFAEAGLARFDEPTGAWHVVEEGA